MKLSDLKSSGHWPTLLTAFLYFDFSFMVWTLLGALGPQIAESLHLDAGQKGMMVAVPILGGAILRLVLGVLSDRIGAKTTGIIAQIVVMAALAAGWVFGLKDFHATLVFGFVLGIAGASFAVALPQAGRWYPANMQGVVLGLAGAGNVGVVIDSLVGPRLAAAYGWQAVFGFALIPAVLTFAAYAIFSKEAPGVIVKKKFSDYLRLLKEQDAHWFCFYYTVSFGGFVGLASYYGLYFRSEFGLSAVKAGDFAALCTFAGALSRPIGGAISDRVGGIRSMLVMFATAAALLLVAANVHLFGLNVVLFVCVSAVLGMCNGAIFQLLPQRFAKDMGVMTGLVGCGGGMGGFYLASSLGMAKQTFGSCAPGFFAFAALCLIAVSGLAMVKGRWRKTWGASAEARI
ncbi:MAG: transporter [Akkermansiaceae bacterium]|nr:transporter [Akkermansiaceae bacterium]